MGGIRRLEAALFTRMVRVGEQPQDGEAAYDGYGRVRFAAGHACNVEEIVFPAATRDYKNAAGEWIPVVCLAALDAAGVVVGVKALGYEMTAWRPDSAAKPRSASDPAPRRHHGHS